MRLACCDADDSNDELSNDHSESTPDQDTPTAESFDHVEAEGRRTNVHEGGDE